MILIFIYLTSFTLAVILGVYKKVLFPSVLFKFLLSFSCTEKKQTNTNKQKNNTDSIGNVTGWTVDMLKVI